MECKRMLKDHLAQNHILLNIREGAYPIVAWDMKTHAKFNVNFLECSFDDPGWTWLSEEKFFICGLTYDSDDSYLINLSDSSFEEKARMHYKRTGHGIVKYMNYVYVFGGY